MLHHSDKRGYLFWRVSLAGEYFILLATKINCHMILKEREREKKKSGNKICKIGMAID